MGFAVFLFGQPEGRHIVTAAEFHDETVIKFTSEDGRIRTAGGPVVAQPGNIHEILFTTLGKSAVGTPAALIELGIVNIISDRKFEIWIFGINCQFLVGTHPDKISVFVDETVDTVEHTARIVSNDKDFIGAALQYTVTVIFQFFHHFFGRRTGGDILLDDRAFFSTENKHRRLPAFGIGIVLDGIAGGSDHPQIILQLFGSESHCARRIGVDSDVSLGFTGFGVVAGFTAVGNNELARSFNVFRFSFSFGSGFGFSFGLTFFSGSGGELNSTAQQQ